MRVLIQSAIEAEVTQRIGAQPYERMPERRLVRSGYRGRLSATRMGELDLKITKLRQGTYLACFLQPRRKGVQALLAAVQSVYVEGLYPQGGQSPGAHGLTGIEESEISRICKDLDELVRDFRERALEEEYRYLWVDATYVKVLERGRGVDGRGGGHRGAGE